MSRNFPGGGGNYIPCAVGGCAAGGSGAYTSISLVKLDLFAGQSGIIALLASGTPIRTCFIDSLKLFGHSDFSSGASSVNWDVWYWIVERKAAGNAHYEFAFGVYPINDPNTDITFTEAPDAANHGDPGAGDAIRIGDADVAARGNQAVDAWFNTYLSNAQIKTALTTKLVDIMALSPAGCWPLNQALATDRVLDVTGNGADQLVDGSNNPITVGTVAVSANPPGYDFSVTTTTDLVIANAAQSQTATSVALTQAHNIVVANAGQAQTAQNLALTQLHILSVRNANQAQSATSIGPLIPPSGSVSGAAVANPIREGAVTTRVVALAGTIE